MDNRYETTLSEISYNIIPASMMELLRARDQKGLQRVSMME